MAGMYASSERLQEAAFVPQLRVIADETQWDFNAYMQKFHGFPYQRVGIDIFPMDTHPEDEETEEMQKVIVQRGMAILREYDRLEETGELEGYLRGFEDFCGIKLPREGNVKNRMWRVIDAVACMFEGEDFPDLNDCGVWGLRRYHVKKEWYDNVLYVPFEHIKIPVPAEYDKVLRTQFWDYTILKQNAGGHDYPFYGHMEAELEKQVRAVGFTGDIDDFCEKVSKGELYV